MIKLQNLCINSKQHKAEEDNNYNNDDVYLKKIIKNGASPMQFFFLLAIADSDIRQTKVQITNNLIN